MPVRNVLREVYDKSGYADLIDTVGDAFRDLSGASAALVRWFQNGSKGSVYQETGLSHEELKNGVKDLQTKGILIENAEGRLVFSPEGLKAHLDRDAQWQDSISTFERNTQVDRDLTQAEAEEANEANLTQEQKAEVKKIEQAEKPLAVQHPKQEDFEKAFLNKFPNMHEHIIGLLQEGPCPLELLKEMLPTQNIQRTVFQNARKDLQGRGLDLQDVKGLIYIVDRKQTDNMSKKNASLAIQVARMLLHEGACPFDFVKTLASDPSSAAASDFKSFQKNIMSKVRDILEKYMKDFKQEGTTYVLRDLTPQELAARKEQRQKRKTKTSSTHTATQWFDSVLQGELSRLTLQHRASLMASSVKSPLIEG